VKKYSVPNGCQYCEVIKRIDSEFSSRRYWESFKSKAGYHITEGRVMEYNFVRGSKNSEVFKGIMWDLNGNRS
jgi:hypothetical protein